MVPKKRWKLCGWYKGIGGEGESFRAGKARLWGGGVCGVKWWLGEALLLLVTHPTRSRMQGVVGLRARNPRLPISSLL